MRVQSLHFSAALLSLTLSACPAADDVPAESDTEAVTTGVTEGGSTGVVDSTGGDSLTDGTSGGAEVFLQLCSPCHGAGGEGTTLGYEIRHPVRDYSAWVVRNGRPGTEFEESSMAAYAEGTISDETLDEMWDYLDAFPQPTTGEALYLDYCRNCHGADALGGVTDVNIREPEALAELLDKVREGANPGDLGARTEFMPAFDQSRLTDAEVQLILDYVAGL